MLARFTRLCLSAALIALGGLATAPCLAGRVLVVRKDSEPFWQVKSGLAQELGNAYRITDLVIDQSTTYDTFISRAIDAKPDVILLMDNISVELAREMYRQRPAALRHVKSVATMALHLKHELKGHADIAGVAYEVPGLTIITSFRHLLKTPVRHILTFYRKQGFAETVLELQRQLAREGIALIAFDVDRYIDDAAALTAFLTENLQPVVRGKKIDAVFVLSDNALINAQNFAEVWVAKARTLPVPFLCGIERFMARDMDFCTYGAAPDHRALGKQVAEIITSMTEDGLSPRDIGVEYILSATKTVNLDLALRHQLMIDHRRLPDVKLAW